MKKIGRNDPCPCGSGKKFKKCHLGREDELVLDSTGQFSEELSKKITSLPPVEYGLAKDILARLDIESLTGSSNGIRFIDLSQYAELNVFGKVVAEQEKWGSGGIVVNPYKTTKSDPNNTYIAISPNVTESILIHQVAHVLDYLGGSGLVPGVVKPLSYELGIPVEHLEHPREFGYWLKYLQKEFDVKLDADDTIILYLYEHEMLIPGDEIKKQDHTLLKIKSAKILKFLSEKSGEIDSLICELPGYIGSRVVKD